MPTSHRICDTHKQNSSYKTGMSVCFHLSITNQNSDSVLKYPDPLLNHCLLMCQIRNAKHSWYNLGPVTRNLEKPAWVSHPNDEIK